MSESVNNPMVMYKSNLNWLPNTAENEKYRNINNVWNDFKIAPESENGSGKSIFDPSPLGWKLANVDIWQDFKTTNFSISGRIGTYKGFAIYPITGSYYGVGGWYNCNYYGSCNSNSVITVESTIYFSFANNVFNTKANIQSSYGLTCRAIKEIKEP